MASGVVALAWGITAREVVKETARQSGIMYSEIMSKRRSLRTVAARQAAMYVMRYAAGMSYQEIGRALRRDHSTVISGIRRCESQPDVLSLAKDVQSSVIAAAEKRVQW